MANSWQEEEDTDTYEEFTLKEPFIPGMSDHHPSWKQNVGSILMIVGLTVGAVIITDLTMRAVSRWLD